MKIQHSLSFIVFVLLAGAFSVALLIFGSNNDNELSGEPIIDSSFVSTESNVTSQSYQQPDRSPSQPAGISNPGKPKTIAENESILEKLREKYTPEGDESEIEDLLRKNEDLKKQYEALVEEGNRILVKPVKNNTQANLLERKGHRNLGKFNLDRLKQVEISNIEKLHSLCQDIGLHCIQNSQRRRELLQFLYRSKGELAAKAILCTGFLSNDSQMREYLITFISVGKESDIKVRCALIALAQENRLATLAKWQSFNCLENAFFCRQVKDRPTIDVLLSKITTQTAKRLLQSAMLSLRRTPNSQAKASIINILRNTTDKEVKISAISSLSANYDKEVEGVLADLLSFADDEEVSLELIRNIILHNPSYFTNIETIWKGLKTGSKRIFLGFVEAGHVKHTEDMLDFFRSTLSEEKDAIVLQKMFRILIKNSQEHEYKKTCLLGLSSPIVSVRLYVISTVLEHGRSDVRVILLEHKKNEKSKLVIDRINTILSGKDD